jgi:hypothetical protein
MNEIIIISAIVIIICIAIFFMLRKQKSTQPSASQPSASQPSASQPSASQPSASQPSASQPSASQPSASQPSASQPSASQPSASQPSASQPSTSQPSASQPSASQPSASQPSASQPGASQPSASQPSASQPSASQPGASQPQANTLNNRISRSTQNQSRPSTINHINYHLTTNPLNVVGARFYIKNNIGLFICSNFGILSTFDCAQLFTVSQVDTNGNLVLSPTIFVQGGEPAIYGKPYITSTSYSLSISPGPPDIVAVHNSDAGDFLVNISNSINQHIVGYYTLNSYLATCTRVPA